MLRLSLEITCKNPLDGGLDLKQIGEVQIVNHVHEDGFYHIRGWINEEDFIGLRVKHDYDDGAFVLLEKAMKVINVVTESGRKSSHD